MKARADDRRIFSSGIQPHVLAIQESNGLDAKEVTEALNAPLERGQKQNQISDISQDDVAHLIALFEYGKTFGSLIRIPEKLVKALPMIFEQTWHVLSDGTMFAQPKARATIPLVEQSQILAKEYGVVVTNPPYMGSKFFNPQLKNFVNTHYVDEKGDLDR